MKHKTRTTLFIALLAIASGPCRLCAQYTFMTFAGNVGYGSQDGTGTVARLWGPAGIAADTNGNIYFADGFNNTIRKMTPARVVTTLAGLAGNPGSANGTGSAARFNGPSGVAIDGGGNLYVADYYNGKIRKISPAGVVTTLAGIYNSPFGVAVDGATNVYVADSSSATIRKITPTGVVTTLAGLANNPGSSDGTGSAARFYSPVGVAVDGTGNVYVTDYGNSTIRKITSAGVVTTLAGSAGLDGDVDGTGSAARFYRPTGLALDASGNLWVADTYNSLIRRVTAAGAVTRLPGAARFASVQNYLQGLAVDSATNIFVADSMNNTIQRATPDGAVTTLIGLPGGPGSTDGLGDAAKFSGPCCTTVDTAGNIYVTDTGNNTLRKITPEGAVTTLAGAPGAFGTTDATGSAARFGNSNFGGPRGVAADSAGNLYVADTGNQTIRKVTPGGTVTTWAGTAYLSGSADGIGGAARFNGPSGVAVDGAGNVYVADANNHTIRKITPARVVTTLAGLAGNFGSTNGTGSVARFYYPSGMAVDGTGIVYVADSANSTIRKITPAGAVTTLAGLAGVFGSANGTGIVAQFNSPSGVAVDNAGNVFVADFYNNTIRKVTQAGVVTTLAGLATNVSGSADGIGSAARFNNPSGIAVGNAGILYVVDSANNTIRKGFPPNLGFDRNTAGLSISNGFFRMQLIGTAVGNVVVDATGNFQTWTPIRTNSFPSNGLVTVPLDTNNYRFFRARLLP